jgi:deoxyribodipyrimidine photo-lyase
MSTLIDSLLVHHGQRIRVLRDGEPDSSGRAVVYWMQRAQRVLDNPALDLAVKLGNALKLPVVIVFLLREYPSANLRHYQFMLEGLAETARDCRRRGMGFVLRKADEADLPQLCAQLGAALAVCDENPCHEPRRWREEYARRLTVPLLAVDADVIVPSRLLLKEQYAARIARPRLQALLPSHLLPLANPLPEKSWNHDELVSPEIDRRLLDSFRLDTAVAPSQEFTGGTSQALRRLREFTSRRLPLYSQRHGKPEYDGTSQLSPYLHFGQIGPLTIALAAIAAEAPEAEKTAYLDQLITWRELAINLAHYNENYDSLNGAENWALKTLADHARDEREFIYSREQFEQAETHDPLWNAAERQMTGSGWMHNYMRMYWAKKILEWSASPAEAFATAAYLNDKYQLDGRDPNGYAGILWAIAGKYDRPWGERPVYGIIRSMSANGAGRKFDSKAYIRQMTQPRLLL